MTEAASAVSVLSSLSISCRNCVHQPSCMRALLSTGALQGLRLRYMTVIIHVQS